MKMGANGVSSLVRGMEEVVTALEPLSPSRSLIRIARIESMNVRLPFREEGHEPVEVRILVAARSATSSPKGSDVL
jgi:hypothetical protein